MPESLVPAAELARRSPVRFPNESAAYRAARTALLAEEIDLRRHLERVAAQRRALPPGGEVIGDYRFEGERGPMSFADLFGDKQTLAVYSYMFGPERERPCPMCTNLLGGLGRKRGRYRAAHCARRGRPFADRAARRLEAGARMEQPAALQRPQRQLFPRLSRLVAGRHGGSELQCLHASRRDHPSFLGRRDDGRCRRSRPGSPRRSRLRAAMERARYDAGRAEARTGIRS